MLRTRLFKSFAMLLVLFGTVSTLFSIKMVRTQVIAEAQNQVRLNLNSAKTVFHNEQQRMITALQLLAGKRELLDLPAAGGADAGRLRERLEDLRANLGLDFLTIVDAQGRVVMRAAPPYNADDLPVPGYSLNRALQGAATAAPRIMTAEELRLENAGLPERARLEAPPDTRRPAAARQTAETRGLVIEAAAPITADNELYGAVYGGILLNRNERMVDQIRAMIYQDEQYRGRPTGSATIFLDDLRVSTTIRLPDGRRALGTRSSREIAAQVLEQGRPWIGRACVLGECYLTAYAPIADRAGQPLGMLYVGILEQPFIDLQYGIIWRYALLFALFISLALLLAFTTAGRLTRPMHRLVEAAHAVMQGRYPPPVPLDNTGSEADILLRTFNRMMQQLNERENTLKQANDSLQAINRNYMDMLGYIAHEMKSPVGAILNYVYLLHEGKLGNLSDKQARAVQNIDNNIKLILEMIRHYLNLSRIENNELQPAPERLEVNADVLRPLLDAYAPEIEDNHIVLDNRVADATMLSADLNMTREIFENLISNAVKYGRAGGRIEIAGRPAGRMIEFTVRNDGEGIPAGKLEVVFNKFVRLDTHRRIRHQRGTGLGLFITRKIVEAHGGKIEAQSEPGAWTLFRFTLPACDKEG